MSVTVEHAYDLLNKPAHAAFQEVARTIPAFAAGLATRLATPPSHCLPESVSDEARKVYEILVGGY